MKKRLMLITVGLTIPFLFACAEEEVEIPVESISLNKTELTLNIGEEFTLKASAKPKEAIQEFVWKSAEPNAVYVVGGKLHAYSIPTTHDDGGDYTTITVSNYAKDKKDLKTATCKVYVTNIPHDDSLEANGLTISENIVELSIGDTKEVFATVTPLGLANEDKEVEWTLSEGGDAVVNLVENFQPDSTAATFAEKNSSKVTITAVAAGNAVLTAKDKKTGEFSGQCAIKVNPEPEVVHVESITFSEDSLYIEQGKTGKNNLTILPWGAENKEITYESSNESVATVSSDGTVLVKADATIGATATITATSVDTPTAIDSFTITVSEHHSDYIFINKVSDPGWKAYEMPLKESDDSEYHIASIELDIGDQFVFCTGVDAGNETWHHYAQLKDGEGSAKQYFSEDDGNIVCSRGGTFEFYVQSDPSECDWAGEEDPKTMKSIWVSAKSLDPLPDLTMTVVHNGTPGTPVVCGHVGTGENEYGVENRSFEAGDEVIFNFGSVGYGFNELKDGGAKGVLSQGTTSTNHIKFNASLTYSLYVDVGNVEHGKRIWAAANYIQKYTASTETWSYADIPTSEEFHKENEYVAANVSLEVGDKVLFNVANGYRKYDDIKADCPVINDVHSDDDNNIVIDVAGTYTFYVMTDNEYGYPKGIWIDVSVAPSADKMLLVKDGDSIALTPKSATECDVLGQTLTKNTQFVASIAGTIYFYEDLKIEHDTEHGHISGGVSDLFVQGDEYETTGKHYLKVSETLKYDIYVNTTADDFGDHIYVSANYMKKFNGTDWSVSDIYLNDEHEDNTTEFKVSNVTLNKDDKVIFCIGGNWYKSAQMKAAADDNAHLYFGDDSGDIKVLASGTYTMYIQTSNDEQNGIWIIGELTANKFQYEKVAGGDTTTVNLSLKPGAKDEFLTNSISFSYGNKIRFNVDGVHLSKKSGGASGSFSAMDSDGYLTCQTAGTYKFYVKFIGDDLGIYIVEPNPTYILSRSQISWNVGGASFYAWAYEYEGGPGHWFKGTLDENYLTFTIPSNYTMAVIARVQHDMQGEYDLDSWDAIYTTGEQWNRSPDDGKVVLNGVSGGRSWSLVDWF